MGQCVDPGLISGQGARTWAGILPAISSSSRRQDAGAIYPPPPPFRGMTFLPVRDSLTTLGKRKAVRPPILWALNYCFSCKVGGNVLDFTLHL